MIRRQKNLKRVEGTGGPTSRNFFRNRGRWRKYKQWNRKCSGDPLLRCNGEDERRGGGDNGLNAQESEYVQNKVGRWLK